MIRNFERYNKYTVLRFDKIHLTLTLFRESNLIQSTFTKVMVVKLENGDQIQQLHKHVSMRSLDFLK